MVVDVPWYINHKLHCIHLKLIARFRARDSSFFITVTNNRGILRYSSRRFPDRKASRRTRARLRNAPTFFREFQCLSRLQDNTMAGFRTSKRCGSRYGSFGARFLTG